MNLYKVLFYIFTLLEIISITFSAFIVSSLISFLPWHDECGMQIFLLAFPYILILIVSLGFLCISSRFKLPREIYFHGLIYIGICVITFNILKFMPSLLFTPILILSIIILLSLVGRIIYVSYKVLKTNSPLSNDELT
ncbi:MAG: hypothetical protein RR840_01665 [Clostridium sp.]